MSESKHTPGPWYPQAEGSECIVLSTSVPSTNGWISPKATWIALTQPCNAHLIAEAPTMYETLEALLCRYPPSTYDVEKARAILDRINKAYTE